jgi:hypothetical protein
MSIRIEMVFLDLEAGIGAQQYAAAVLEIEVQIAVVAEGEGIAGIDRVPSFSWRLVPSVAWSVTLPWARATLPALSGAAAVAAAGAALVAAAIAVVGVGAVTAAGAGWVAAGGLVVTAAGALTGARTAAGGLECPQPTSIDSAARDSTDTIRMHELHSLDLSASMLSPGRVPIQ